MTAVRKARSSTASIWTPPGSILGVLREGILNGTYPGGTVLRQEDIAARFRVSRMPVRDAFHQLASEGLLIRQSHRGAVVVELSADDLGEIAEMRAALEPLALRLAMPKLGRGPLGRAEDLLDQADQETDGARLSALNWEFHSALYAVAERPRLIATIQNLHLNVDRYMRVILTAMRYKGRSQAEHRRLLKACHKRDVPLACALLERHILDGGKRLVRFLAAHRSP